MTLSSERAREMALKSHVARRAKAAAQLTLANVEAELGPLQTLEDAMRRLDRLGIWAASGMISGSVASAFVRSVEVWVRAHESKLTRELVEGLAAEVRRIKAQFKARGLSVVK